jgi:regulator of RNase E activity RraA
MKSRKKKLINGFKKLSTTDISDALDRLGLRGAVIGISPMFPCPRIVGFAVTVKVTAAGLTKSKQHLGINAIDAASPGDIIVIDNAGRRDVSCWGEILTVGALMKSIAGVVIDGAFRDLDVIKTLSFPVFARGVVPVTARGRVMQESFNVLIQCGGVQVRPGDIIIGDDNGVVVVPREMAEEVLKIAIELHEKERMIVEELRRGIPISEVDKKFRYEEMLKR